MDPLSVVTAIAAPVIGGIFKKKSTDRQVEAARDASALTREDQNYWNQVSIDFANKQFEEAKRQFGILDDRASRAVRTRVLDAQAAGIHPLFALGQSANLSPTMSAGSPSFATGAGDPSLPITGSALGEGIGRAATALASLEQDRRQNRAAAREEKRQAALHAANLKAISARTKVDEMTAARIASETKRAEQTALVKRGTGDGTQAEGGAIVRPLPPELGGTTQFGRRQVRIEPAVDKNLDMRVHMPDGGQLDLVDPSVGEEYSQIVNAYRIARYWVSRWME